MNLTCACGSDSFKSPKVTLVLRGVPCQITEDGPDYDDTEAEQSEGWDYNEENRIVCVTCGREYDISQDGEGNICLEPAPKEDK